MSSKIKRLEGTKVQIPSYRGEPLSFNKYRKPWFANRLVSFYEDPTEPNLFPQEYTRYIEMSAITDLSEKYEQQMLEMREEIRLLKLEISKSKNNQTS